jgi:hypothetical protein
MLALIISQPLEKTVKGLKDWERVFYGRSFRMQVWQGAGLEGQGEQHRLG